MEIRVVWQQPLSLRDGSSEGLIYACEDPALIPNRPGIYVFARRHGDAVSPLYIGQAENLAKRIPQQLNNVKLMNGMKNAPTGERILLVGELALRSGQRVSRVLEVVENALIEYARRISPLRMNVRQRA